MAPRTVPIEIKVSEWPMYRRLYQAVDDYLWTQVREQGQRTPLSHATWCELIDAHDAIAAHLAAHVSDTTDAQRPEAIWPQPTAKQPPGEGAT